MEDNAYINDDCILENEAYKIFKDKIICDLCKKILKEPIICKNCQQNYCKVCIDEWKKKENKCPNNCNKPDYAKSVDKPGILAMLTFLCRNCKEEIKYNDVESHLKSGCKKVKNPTKLIDFIYRKRKLYKLTKDEVKKVKEEGHTIRHISSKIKYIILTNSYNYWKTKCRKIIFN